MKKTFLVEFKFEFKNNLKKLSLNRSFLIKLKNSKLFSHSKQNSTPNPQLDHWALIYIGSSQ